LGRKDPSNWNSQNGKTKNPAGFAVRPVGIKKEMTLFKPNVIVAGIPAEIKGHQKTKKREPLGRARQFRD